MFTVRTDEPDFDIATAIAVERSPFDSISNLMRVRTHRSRVLTQPERVLTKDHNRDYGKERRHPHTSGTRLVRSFVFVK